MTDPRNTSPLWIQKFGVAAAVVAIVIISAACSTAEDGSATTPLATTTTAVASTTTTTTATPSPTTTVAVPGTTLVPPESVVAANHDAWNRGDYEGWLATFTEAAARDQDRDSLPQILMNANDHIELTQPCTVAAANSAGESTVRCFGTGRDDFHGPAGIVDDFQEIFVVGADGMIISMETFGQCCDAQFAFNREYWRWLLVAHPDIYADIEPADGEALPGWERDPADMLVAVQYVDEFIAQSDDYPITP